MCFVDADVYDFPVFGVLYVGYDYSVYFLSDLDLVGPYPSVSVLEFVGFGAGEFFSTDCEGYSFRHYGGGRGDGEVSPYSFILVDGSHQVSLFDFSGGFLCSVVHEYIHPRCGADGLAYAVDAVASDRALGVGYALLAAFGWWRHGGSEGAVEASSVEGDIFEVVPGCGAVAYLYLLGVGFESEFPD